MTPVLTRTLARERRLLVGWLAGIGLLALITIGSWPSIRGSSADFERILASMPDALTAFFGEGIANFSAAGVIGSRLYGTIGLAVVIGFAVSRGSRAIAGEAQDGTLELLVTQPVSRAAIAVDKVVAAALALAVLVLVEVVVLLVSMPLVGLDFAVVDVVGASLGLYLLAGLFGAVAFAVGAATLNRQAAVAAGAGLAAGLFLLAGLGGLVAGLRPIADLSPFSLYDGTAVLAHGVDAGPLLVFAAVSVALVGAGVVAFDRRDLS